MFHYQTVVIVNADDFGEDRESNRVIERCHRTGIVTSVSLIANLPGFEEAVAILKANPRLDVGIHLNIFSGVPLSQPREVRSLIGQDGKFTGSVSRFLNRWASCRINPAEIRKEWQSQIERLIVSGLRLSHLDSHYHFHLLPDLFLIALQLAETYRIPWVRAVGEPVQFDVIRNRRGLSKLWKELGLYVCSRLAIPQMEAKRIRGGVTLWSGGPNDFLTEPALRTLIGGLRPGIHEVFVHPGVYREEAELLTDPTVIVAARSAWRLTSFGDLLATGAV